MSVATYKVVRMHDHDANFETYSGFDPKEFRAYYMEKGEWHHLYGKSGPNLSLITIFEGYAQGDKLRVNHDGLSRERLEFIASAWRDGFQGVVVKVWNPEPGVGWEYVGSLWGISYSATEEELKQVAEDIAPKIKTSDVRWSLKDEEIVY